MTAKRNYAPLDADELVPTANLGTGAPDGTKFLRDDQTFAVPPGTGGGGAPATADYLVGTADGGLSAEIVVGTTPGGELGGTWGSPTVDASHSGSTHAATQAAAEATAAGALSTHAGAADPHTGYQKESEKSAASGYASLDGSTKVPIAELPTGTSGTTVALGDAAAALDATHAGAADPHTGYQKESEKDAANGYAGLSAGGLVPIAHLATGTPDGTKYVRDDGTLAAPSGSGAPASVDYLVGTADGGLSGEIVVGTTPGGELGGTWPAPTVDPTHSGSDHRVLQVVTAVSTTNDATTSATLVDSSLSATITPKTASSLLLITVDGSVQAARVAGTIAERTVDVAILNSTDAVLLVQQTRGRNLVATSAVSGTVVDAIALRARYTVNSTAARTFKLQHKTNTVTNVQSTLRGATETGGILMTIMEIAP